GSLGLFDPAASEIPDSLDVRLLMTADGCGHEALLRHSAREGFLACGGVLFIAALAEGNLAARWRKPLAEVFQNRRMFACDRSGRRVISRRCPDKGILGH